MNYELAKKLKDVGFPFKEWHLGTLHMDGVTPANYPTLSELIEACVNIMGKEVICIGTMFKENSDYEHGPWHAATYKKMFELPTTSVFGKTPEKAVANLWLRLNKKENEDR